MKIFPPLLHVLRRSRALLLMALVAGVIGGAANAGLLAVLNTALGETAVEEGAAASGRLGWIFAGLCLLVPVSRVGSQYLFRKLTERVALELRLELGRRILTAPLTVLERVGRPRLTASFANDVNAIADSLSLVPTLIIHATIVLGCLAYLGWLSPPLFLLTLAFMAVGVATYTWPMRAAQQRLIRSREEYDTLFGAFRSLVEGIKELKLHSPRRRAFGERYAASGEKLADTSLEAGLLFGIAGSYGQLLFFLLLGLLLFVVDGEGRRPEVLIGYALVVLYMRESLQMVVDGIPLLARARVASAQLERLEIFKPLPGAEAPAALPAAALPKSSAWQQLEMRGVVFAHGGTGQRDAFVLGPLDLELRRGELIFLAGGNGSGKTTLAKLLTGLYAPDEGEVLLDGEPVDEAGRDEYRQLFSTVFGDFHLFEDLLGLMPDELDGRAEELLAKLQLDHKIDIRQGRFSSLALSQGQRKRLALLTAWLEDRSIYLFDEWAADQDPHFREIFYRQLLPELVAWGKTVVAISHDDRYYDVADRLIRLDYGRIRDDAI